MTSELRFKLDKESLNWFNILIYGLRWDTDAPKIHHLEDVFEMCYGFKPNPYGNVWRRMVLK